jgi:hypothetical protein
VLTAQALGVESHSDAETRKVKTVAVPATTIAGHHRQHDREKEMERERHVRDLAQQSMRGRFSSITIDDVRDGVHGVHRTEKLRIVKSVDPIDEPLSPSTIETCLAPRSTSSQAATRRSARSPRP